MSRKTSPTSSTHNNHPTNPKRQTSQSPISNPQSPISGGATWADLAQSRAPTHWDWPGWLPRGYLTILASQPGTGKSSLCLHLAAAYADGRPWPDGAPFTAQPSKTLWGESENGHEMNLERWLTWGLDPAQIVTPLGDPQRNFTLATKQDIRDLLLPASRPDVRLIVLDSLTGLSSGNTSPRALRDLVAGLAEIARAVRKPVLLTHHLRKRTTLDGDGQLNLDRLLGSSLIAQVPRVVWTLDLPNPADPDNRRLSVIKNNLAPIPNPIGFRIDAHGLHFGPPPQPPTVYSELDRAIDFLQDLLAAGPLPATQVKAAAHAAGHAERTLKRAKQHLCIKSNKHPDQWTWQLPPD